MSARPSDWSALGLVSDPTPGDPGVVRGGAVRYRDIADAIRRCADNLRALDAGATGRAESVTALLEQRDTLVDGVDKAEGRYRSAGDALETYSTALDRVQADTLNALYAARQAVWERDEARDNQRYYEQLAEEYANVEDDSGFGHDQWVRYTNLARNARAEAVEAQGRIDNQIQVVHNAIQERDQAAQAAINAIQHVTASDGLNEGWWENWGAKVIGWVATIAEWISTITGLLALVAAWIPFVGQGAAVVLLAISAATGIVAAIADIALFLKGEIGWGEALLSVVFGALGCIGLGGVRGLKLFGKLGSAVSRGAHRSLLYTGKNTSASLRACSFVTKMLVSKGGRAYLSGGAPFFAKVGRLGEELVRVSARSKKTFNMGRYGLPPGRRTPDMYRKIFGKAYVGEVKSVKSLKDSKKQLEDFAEIAREETDDRALHLFYFADKVEDLDEFRQLWKGVSEVDLVLHPVEELLGVRTASVIVATSSGGRIIDTLITGR